jgi:hypothetical protein
MMANLQYRPKLESKEDKEIFEDTWFICFRNYSDAIFAKAVYRIINRENNFPSIAKVKEYCRTEIRNARFNQKALPEPEPSQEQRDEMSKILNDLKEKLAMRKKQKEESRR